MGREFNGFETAPANPDVRSSNPYDRSTRRVNHAAGKHGKRRAGRRIKQCGRAIIPSGAGSVTPGMDDANLHSRT
jgi:hypothetical protein